MVQGTEEWLAWRRKGLGGSDAGVVMGVSPWRTRYELWLEKTGRYRKKANEFITEKGHKYEDRARALYQIFDDRSYPPQLVTSHFYDYLRVSLDGYCEENTTPMEIKFQGRREHRRVGLYRKIVKRYGEEKADLIPKRKFIPEKYWAQIQYQLLVTEAKQLIFLSYNDVLDEIEWITILPDRPYQVELMSAMKRFWNENILGDKMPELTAKDYLLVKDEDTEVFEDLYEIDEALKIKEDALKKEQAEFQKMLSKVAEKYDHLNLRTKTGVKVKTYKTKRKMMREECA